MYEIFCKIHILGKEVTKQFLVAFWQILETQVGFTIG